MLGDPDTPEARSSFPQNGVALGPGWRIVAGDDQMRVRRQRRWIATPVAPLIFLRQKYALATFLALALRCFLRSDHNEIGVERAAQVALGELNGGHGRYDNRLRSKRRFGGV